MIKAGANRIRFTLIALSFAIALLNTFSLLTQAQGFGIFKKDIHYYRLRPPKVPFGYFAIDVRVGIIEPPKTYSYAIPKDKPKGYVSRPLTSPGLTPSDFQNRLERFIQAGDPRINVNPQLPQLIVDCKFIGISRTESWSKRSETQKQKVGEQEVYNEKKKKMEKKDVEENVKVDVPYLKITWELVISFEIEDAQTRQRLAADRYRYYETEDYKEGKNAAQWPTNLRSWADQQAQEIAAYVVPTREPVKLLLPKGKLDDISDKIEKRQLQEALQQLEDMPALKKSEDEAYKFYILGVCYEAMAYETGQDNLAGRYFEQAGLNYTKALGIKPDEKYFKEAQTRLQTSIAYHKRLSGSVYASGKTTEDGNRKAPLNTLQTGTSSVTAIKPANSGDTTRPDRVESKNIFEPIIPPKTEAKNSPESKTTEPKAAESKAAPLPAKPKTENKDSEALTNDTIIKLVKAGLSEENVIATINEARATSFDLSPNAQVQLIQSGVTNRIISAMRQAKKSK